MDIFTEIQETLRLKVLEEYTIEELLAEIQRRGNVADTTMRVLENVLDPEFPLDVVSLDEMGPGGAYHVYEIRKLDGEVLGTIKFQKGNLTENGINGVFNEALLLILIDRLDCFNKGPFPSRPTAVAKTKCEEAHLWLNYRTAERRHRGVEGQDKE